jgi:hypothetical protein
MYSPTGQGDQDALNAILMSVIPADALCPLPRDEQVTPGQYPYLRSVNEGALTCRYQGQEPLILHASLLPKPWEARGVCMPGWLRGRPNQDVYLRFLRRLLTAPDVAYKVPAPLLKIWLRSGLASDLEVYGRAVVNALARRLVLEFFRHN